MIVCTYLLGFLWILCLVTHAMSICMKIYVTTLFNFLYNPLLVLNVKAIQQHHSIQLGNVIKS